MARGGGELSALTSSDLRSAQWEGGVVLETQTYDEIQTYVPTFPKKQWPVTLRQLMGHVSGIRNDAGDEESLELASGHWTR